MKGTTKANYESVINSISDLHGNMSVLSKLDTMLKDANANLTDVERLIETDGTLTASIIRISNSAQYSTDQKHNDIDSALQTLGFSEVLKLVSLAISKQVFMRELDAYGISADSYWSDSYFAALFMEAQAERIGLDPHQAYLLGLLRNIGQVVINELLFEREIEIYWDRFVPHNQWEIAMIGFTNEIAGATLLRNWNFSPEIYQRVANKSDPQIIEADNLIMLLDFASKLSIALDDHERLQTLYHQDAHPYPKKWDLQPSEIESDTLEAQKAVSSLNNSLKDC